LRLRGQERRERGEVVLLQVRVMLQQVELCVSVNSRDGSVSGWPGGMRKGDAMRCGDFPRKRALVSFPAGRFVCRRTALICVASSFWPGVVPRGGKGVVTVPPEMPPNEEPARFSNRWYPRSIWVCASICPDWEKIRFRRFPESWHTARSPFAT
jgi:hypothetical protein